MKKILFINTTLNIGSTGRIVEQIAQQSGMECYIAHGGRYVGKSKFNSIEISSKFDNILHAFAGEFLGRHGLGSIVSTMRFVRKIKKIKPDIIHLHNIHGYYLNYKILFKYLSSTNIPIIWTLHDCWAFTGHCTHFDNIGCDKWKTECGSCSLLMAQYKSRLVDRSRENYLLKKKLYYSLSNLTIVPVSNWLGNLVSQSILGKFPIKVINNGVDVNIFKPKENTIRQRYNIDTNKIIVLGVVGSGLGVEKGKREFIELSYNKNYQVILIGLSKNDVCDLPDNIIKIGRTSSQSELAEFYSAADVLLNPTYNDTFPTVNLEAIACGTPVITYNTGGSPETLSADTGIIVDKGDINGMMNALQIIQQNSKGAYSHACRERAVMFFSKERKFEAYISLYQELLSNN